MLNVGDTAPAFSGETQTGEAISLDQFKGKTVVLYFYPKDNTPGCTKEACSFRDKYETLAGKDVVVVGVSADSVKSHQNFVSKFDLPFYLLSDSDKKVINAYGAWGEKKMYGKAYEGILRITYIIGPDSKIHTAFPKVKTATHAEEILAALG